MIRGVAVKLKERSPGAELVHLVNWWCSTLPTMRSVKMRAARITMYRRADSGSSSQSRRETVVAFSDAENW